MEDSELQCPLLLRQEEEDEKEVDCSEERSVVSERILQQPAGTPRARDCYEAPEFIHRLSAFQEVRAGSTVVFSCSWRGLPRPNVKWYKDDEQLPEDPRYSVIEEPGGILRLKVAEVTKVDEGSYKVKAENSEGVCSTTGYLSVTGEAPMAYELYDDYEFMLPPYLRTIVEQKSLEEREAEEYKQLPPSPIRSYIESLRRQQRVPFFVGSALPPMDVDAEGSTSSADSQCGPRNDLDPDLKDLAVDDDVFPAMSTHDVTPENEPEVEHEPEVEDKLDVGNEPEVDSEPEAEVKSEQLEDTESYIRVSLSSLQSQEDEEEEAEVPAAALRMRDMPWLFFTASASVSTFAACSDVISTCSFVQLWLVLAFIAFHFLLTAAPSKPQ